MGPTINDFLIGFCVAVTLMISADYIAVKRNKNSSQACKNILSAAEEYPSIYFLAPGMIIGCQDLKESSK